MRAMLLLGLAVFAVVPCRAQDYSVQIACQNGLVDRLSRGFLRCTSDPPLYRDAVQRERVRSVAYVVEPTDSEIMAESSSLARYTVVQMERRPIQPVRDTVRACPERVCMASVYPVDGEPALLRVNKFLGPDTDTAPLDGNAVADTVAYYVQFERNRQAVQFIHRSDGVLPFVVPVKVRWRSRDLPDSTAADGLGSTRAASQISLGMAYTWRAAERTYRYEAGSKAPVSFTGFNWSFGLGVGFSVEEVNEANTLSAPGTFSGRRANMLIASPTASLQSGYGDFLVGLYGGRDYGLTTGAGAWDFNGSWWIGIGVSTKLPFSF